jgi:hypothetical protein
MKRATIKTAMEIAKRFIEVAKKLEKENDKMLMNKVDHTIFRNESIAYTRESAQLKRVSMDLTHILADLRLNR